MGFSPLVQNLKVTKIYKLKYIKIDFYHEMLVIIRLAQRDYYNNNIYSFVEESFTSIKYMDV